MTQFDLIVFGIVGVIVSLLIWAGPATTTSLFAFASLVALLTLRPGWAGEVVGPLGALILLTMVALVSPRELRRLGDPPGNQVGALALVLLASAALVGIDGLNVNTLSGLAVTPLAAAGGWLLAANPQRVSKLAKYVSVLALYQSAALVVSEIMGFRATEYALSDGFERAGWIFRVTSVGAVTTGGGGVLGIFSDRLTGPFGEPGVFASFLGIFGVIALVMDNRWRVRMQVPFLAGIVLSQSIAGIGIYFAGVVTFYVLKYQSVTRFRIRDYLLVACALTGSVWAAAQDDGLLAAKNQANSISLQQRTRGTSPGELLSSWMSFPFGLPRNAGSTGINLIQSSIDLGPIIMVLGLWLYLAPLRAPHAARAAPIVAAVALTVLFSQPPFLYAWVYAAFVAAGLANHPRALEAAPRSHAQGRAALARKDA